MTGTFVQNKTFPYGEYGMKIIWIFRKDFLIKTGCSVFLFILGYPDDIRIS